MKKIDRLLVANRGEIAIRIFRAASDLSIKTVGVYSKEDKFNLFRMKADEAYLLGENRSPLAAYLDIDLIIDLAKKEKIDAIHPGYGFLSENANFARACEEAGIQFVGPPSHVLSQMGDKIKAKELAKRCNVPTIPGSEKPISSVEEAKQLAREYGLPVMFKAAAGGGGRGMRLIEHEDEIEAAFEMVKSEAHKAFGCDDIFMEKYLVNPKHIEVQILADNYGNVVHLFERDCSVQRRYQKVVEYAPAFSLSEEKRQELYDDAIKIAKEVNYVNAGTVEFLVDRDGNHYFIEMNPRIQVEHTVTEMITGIDIVQCQLMIAEGYALDSPEINIKSQDDVTMRGYSIQCRVTTEDPWNNFAPDYGKLTTYRSGGGFGVRLDAGNAYTGAEISPYYDSLLVKITTQDRTFKGAIQKSLRAIAEIRIRGVKTNSAFLTNILKNEVFQSGRTYTGFIEDTPELFEVEPSRDRATKVLKFLGDKAVNENCEKPNVVITPRVPKYPEESPKEGLKYLLDQEGPDAVKKWVLDQKKVLMTDTTFRDAHQSLLATRMRTVDMKRISKATSHILKDVFSMEMWGGATFDVAYRFLHESPWTRLDELRAEIPNILFQMLLRGSNAVGYTNYPDELVRAFIRESAASGIDVFRIFDSLNWLPGMELAIDEVLKCGKIAEGTICYTGDILDPKRDKYTLKYYVNLAKELEKRGIQILAIKDMSGLLKPYAAKVLVEALKDELSIPVHLHTHDTSGNQVATLLMATEAGVDVIDTAISSLSSLTSQPSMNSVVAALEGQERETGLDLMELQKLTDYWDDIRPYYHSFEAGIVHPATDIYRYEIPGGQYTNLKPQVESLGLGHRFTEVKEKYKEVNEILGDIVKVTPSSKMVGDLAIFMVQNDLTKDNIVEKGKTLNFPDSVVSYFKGMMGQPEGGFPEDLQKVVLKGEEPITCRPGELLPMVSFDEIHEKMESLSMAEKHIIDHIPERVVHRSVLSWYMYPKVTEDFLKHRMEYSDISHLDSHVFFDGLLQNETTEVTIEPGKTLIIKYIGLGEPNDDGTRNVIFELNGARREVTVVDNTAISSVKEVRMADPDDMSEIASSLPGAVSKILVAEGDEVEENQTLAIIEAMKMETNITAKVSGTVDKIYVNVGDTVKAGELIIQMK
ncbi:MAG TPA: pyruvate carboxylase [Firmicutes bacterium]|nr:pyruvate carboxylase [Bacillota bacterium]